LTDSAALAKKHQTEDTFSLDGGTRGGGAAKEEFLELYEYYDPTSPI